MNANKQDEQNTIVRCVACEGYGWIEADDETGESECAWCAGVGYVFRNPSGIDTRIPPEQLTTLNDVLERLEVERLREMGYSGAAKKPWEQAIRIERGDTISKRSTED